MDNLKAVKELLVLLLRYFPLDIVAGANVTIEKDTNFSVYKITASGSGVSILLKTNGTDNPTQDILNLVAGTNMTITDDGAGNITFDATGGGGSGTVTSIGTAGLISGGTITTTGTITTLMNTNKLVGRGTAGTGVMEEITLGTGLSLSGTTLNASGGSGTVTSVDLTMPAAFSVTGNPITTSGTLAVAAAGLSTQYIRGDGQLANFPTSGGGGSSINYYLNGSVSQGTFGGVAFREMSRTPIFGAGTDFTINANGYIQSFITDANDPNQLAIPAGNWNFEMYFSASSGGGSPSFYVELYKWDGTTLTLIATSSANPEGITNGTAIDLYTTALAVPSTVLAVTDRLAVRVYVTHSGRTIKLHTEDSHLCEIITTFSTGLTALNGLTEQVQLLATGTSGTDFTINSTVSTHTFNIPSSSSLNRGLLLAADWTIFNNKAPLASPAFTGSPTAPTQLTTDNSTKIATTAYVTAAVAVPTAGSNLYLFYNY